MSDSVHVLGGPDLSLTLGRSLSCILTELSQQQRFLQSSNEKSKEHTVGAQWLTLELKNKNPNYSPKKTQLWILKTNQSTISVPTSAWVLLLQTRASSHQVWLPWLSKASARTSLPCAYSAKAPLIGKTGGSTLLTQASPSFTNVSAHIYLLFPLAWGFPDTNSLLKIPSAHIWDGHLPNPGRAAAFVLTPAQHSPESLRIRSRFHLSLWQQFHEIQVADISVNTVVFEGILSLFGQQ